MSSFCLSLESATIFNQYTFQAFLSIQHAFYDLLIFRQNFSLLIIDNFEKLSSSNPVERLHPTWKITVIFSHKTQCDIHMLLHKVILELKWKFCQFLSVLFCSNVWLKSIKAYKQCYRWILIHNNTLYKLFPLFISSIERLTWHISR